MWIAISPLPRDFCGRPPCPKCFEWKEGDQPPLSGLHKMALDLLQKPLDDLSKAQRRKLDRVGLKMHEGGISAFASPPDKSPPPPADIGMSSTRALQGWLRERRRREVTPKPRQLTCDEIYARKAEQEAAEKAKRKEKQERLQEAREIAQVFAEADRGRQQSGDEQMLREVDPSFVSYCRERGIYSAQEIYARWQREYGSRYAMPSYIVDPRKGPSYGY